MNRKKPHSCSFLDIYTWTGLDILYVELNILTPVLCAVGAVVLCCGGQERGGVRHQRGHSGHGDLRVRPAPRQPRVRDANPPGQRHSLIVGQFYEILASLQRFSIFFILVGWSLHGDGLRMCLVAESWCGWVITQVCLQDFAAFCCDFFIYRI